MALAQDLLTRIINVNWSGGLLFVTGDGTGYVRFGEAKEESNVDWKLIGQLQGEQSTFNASSFAMVGPAEHKKPAFVLGGSVVVKSGDGRFARAKAQIYYSSNGSNWSQVWEGANDPEDPGFVQSLMNAMVWDPADKAFYASTGHYEDHQLGDASFQIRFEKGLRSTDGKNWNHVWNNDVLGLDVTYTSPLIAHCKHHEIKDQFGHNLPDGAMFFDSLRDMTIGPQTPFAIDYANSQIVAGGGNQVRIIAKNEEGQTITKTVTVRGLRHIYGVAGTQGSKVWVAAGSSSGEGVGAIAVSFDDGDSWGLVQENNPDIEGFIQTVAGGRKSDEDK